MARKYKVTTSSGCSILLADDDTDYLEATRLLLESEGHEVLCATNGGEVLAMLRRRNPDLLLLDYFMPGMTGEEVVVKLRQFNSIIQVILQTGYVNERPPREMLRRLDIQGYYDKSEGPEKLLLWTDAGLKAAQAIQRLSRSRTGLRCLLDATPAMHKMQPRGDLLESVLHQMTTLLGAVTPSPVSPFASQPPPPTVQEAFLALMQEDSDLIIGAGTSRFPVGQAMEASLSPEEHQQVLGAIERGEVQIGEASTIVPLRVGEIVLGVVYLDRSMASAEDAELLKLFANQATVAIQNMQLYEMAALDPLTGVHARRFFERWLLREVRTALRSQQPVSILLIDMDGLKGINDTGGHLAGDQALAAMGKVLRQATRDTDVVARYGGDEFVVILPQTSAEGAAKVGARILDLLGDKSAPGPNGVCSLRASLGVSELCASRFSLDQLPRSIPPAYFQRLAQSLIQKADEALYQAKRQGGSRLCQGAPTMWEPL